MSVKDNEKVYFGDEKVSKESKKDGVEGIFTKVSENYDLMNDLMSLGMHRVWKKFFVDSANIKENQIILDLAAGTGDISKKISQKVSGKTIYICDQNSEMVEKAKERSLNEGFFNKCNFNVSSAEKLPYEEIILGDELIKICGIAKGSGMIAPNLATMLSFIFTDANIPSVFLKAILKKVSATTFNAITVDGDTSTNDMVAVFATGKAKNSKIYN